ncbi:MAG: GNAT family protein [Xanthobacteraceae bacterium]|jgi:RimJ/RimL family protein N-acetyltransferase
MTDKESFTLFVYERSPGDNRGRSMLMASRITIGPFVPEDFAPVFCWVNDVAAARLDLAYRPVDMMTHQQWWQSLGKDLTKVVFAIRRTTEPTIIGYVQITGINSVHRSAEIGIRIGEEKNRGQGYGKEALRLATEFCWNHLNLNRVQLIVFKHNDRAVRAYKAAGFRKEGLLKKAAFIGGNWVDLILMAALRPAQRKPRRLQGSTAANVVPVARDLRSTRTAAA